MTQKTIEIEAETLEEARKQLQTQIPQGFSMLSEEVISNGKPKTVEAVALTLEAAFTKAHSQVPSNADIIDKKEIAAPESKVVIVEAFDEQSARRQLGNQPVDTARIIGSRLVASGSRGFLGIGKKPNQYEVEVLHQAVVKITYKMKAKILAQIGDKESELRRRAKQIEAELTKVDRELKRAYTSRNDADFANIAIAYLEEQMAGGKSANSPLLRKEKLEKELDSIRQQLAAPIAENQEEKELTRQPDEEDIILPESEMNIFEAAERGDSNVVISQIKSGDDVNAKDMWGNTALMWAAWRGHVEVVKILVEARADVNAKDNGGQTALMKAADQGHTDVVILLIDAKSDVNVKDKNGLTSLIVAAQNRHTDVIRILKNAGAK